MKYNKLLSRKYRAQMVAQGQPVPENRCSGRSTSAALSLISHAIDSPGVWLTVQDHHIAMGCNYRLTNEVMSIAARLELKFFEKRVGHHGPKGVTGPLVYQIRCDMFTDNPWSIE